MGHFLPRRKLARWPNKSATSTLHDLRKSCCVASYIPLVSKRFLCGAKGATGTGDLCMVQAHRRGPWVGPGMQPTPRNTAAMRNAFNLLCKWPPNRLICREEAGCVGAAYARVRAAHVGQLATALPGTVHLVDPLQHTAAPLRLQRGPHVLQVQHLRPVLHARRRYEKGTQRGRGPLIGKRILRIGRRAKVVAWTGGLHRAKGPQWWGYFPGKNVRFPARPLTHDQPFPQIPFQRPLTIAMLAASHYAAAVFGVRLGKYIEAMEHPQGETRTN